MFASQHVAFHQQLPDDREPLPGGYLTFSVMTKMIRRSPYDKFGGITVEGRNQVVPNASKALHDIH